MLRAWGLLALVMAATVGLSDIARANKQAEPADIQNALEQAAKALESGKADQAAQRITTLLSGTRLQGRSMARALYLRGSAYSKQGKPAQAIADLTSALWLKDGLSDAERREALDLRSQAYRAAGLTDLAEADAKKVGQRSGTASAAAWQTDTSPKSTSSTRQNETTPKVAASPPASSGSGGLTNFFSNLFGGGGAASSSGAAAARPDPYGATAARQPSIGQAWSTSVDTKPAGSNRQTASVRQETAALPPKEEPPEKPAAATSKAQGGYRLQVAAVRSRSNAQAVAARLEKEYGAALGGRQPEVDETVIGNMGTFYRVRVGPFANATESSALCTKLRSAGLDCLMMAE